MPGTLAVEARVVTAVEAATLSLLRGVLLTLVTATHLIHFRGTVGAQEGDLRVDLAILEVLVLPGLLRLVYAELSLVGLPGMAALAETWVPRATAAVLEGMAYAIMIVAHCSVPYIGLPVVGVLEATRVVEMGHRAFQLEKVREGAVQGFVTLASPGLLGTAPHFLTTQQTPILLSGTVTQTLGKEIPVEDAAQLDAIHSLLQGALMAPVVVLVVVAGQYVMEAEEGAAVAALRATLVILVIRVLLGLQAHLIVKQYPREVRIQ